MLDFSYKMTTLLLAMAKESLFMAKTYVLLHGAWHASWCWKYLTPLLQKQGHTVFAPDLPGHGAEQTPSKSISLNTYVDYVTDFIASKTQPVTLVGHSMAGIILAEVAEKMPDKIQQLVFVTAFIPENNESMLQTAQKSSSPGVSAELSFDRENNAITVEKSPRVKEAFYNFCSNEDAEFALSRLQKEPFRPFTDAIHISKERFGQVKKRYIVCLNDNALTPKDQQRMLATTSCEVMELNADHSPFFSAPLEFANLLEWE